MDQPPSRQRALAVVAEDLPLLRMETVDFLTDEGFEVHEAPDAATAMDLLERLDGVGLLFTDIRMPGERDGLALAREVASRWPDTRIVICSGLPRPEGLPVGAYFFDKPFLAARVQKVLR